jgi:hypothetical protein
MLRIPVMIISSFFFAVDLGLPPTRTTITEPLPGNPMMLPSGQKFCQKIDNSGALETFHCRTKR